MLELKKGRIEWNIRDLKICRVGRKRGSCAKRCSRLSIGRRFQRTLGWKIRFGELRGLRWTTLARLNSLRLGMFYTYVLQSIGDKKFYVSFTQDLKLRFDQHNKGQVESTKDRRPLKLIYYEACSRREDAIHREKYLKSYNGRRFLHKRLKSYLTG